MIQFSAQTHPGLRREHNEDALLTEPECGLFVVADGVGGRAAGEVASALTVQTFAAAGDELASAVREYGEDPQWSTRNAVLEVLDQVCQRASRVVFDEAEATGKKGMTTTLVAAVVGGGAVFLAHAGDSRAYLIRDGLIRQLTEDHSMINELVRTGQMTYEEASRSRYRSVITRAIGLYPTVQTDLMSIEILPGDRIVLNTDGLSDLVETEVIEDMASQDDVETANHRLVSAALKAGGTDNITVVLVEPEATSQTEASRARAQVMNELFLFQDLPFHARLRVSRICQEVFFTPDQVLVEEGSIGNAMYVIVQGEVRITKNDVELAMLGAREHFGELGLLEDQERSATVVGASYGSAITIERRHLQEFCQREPALGNQLLWRLVQTLGNRLVIANSLAAKNASKSR